MSAITATQVPVSPLNRARGAVMHVRGSLFILGLATAAVWIAWTSGRGDIEPLPIAVISETQVYSTEPAEEALAPASRMVPDSQSRCPTNASERSMNPTPFSSAAIF